MPKTRGKLVLRLWVGLIFLIRLSDANAQSLALTPAANNFYNTGYNGAALAGNNQPDTHYMITNYGSGQAYQANPRPVDWVANPSDSQWITVSNTTTTGPVQTFDYRLILTNIPVGVLVTIHGNVAADDNAVISANSSGPIFSNFSTAVAAGNYNSFTPFPNVTFASGTTNQLNILVDNNGGGPTGLNLELVGSYAPLTSIAGLGIQFTPAGLTPNQTAVVTALNRINLSGVDNACLTNLTVALLQTDAASFGADLDQLSPEKLGVLSSIAFNNASFMTQDLDDYTAHRRDARGNLEVNPDRIDASGLTLTDPTMDPALSGVKSRLLAWSPPVSTPGLLSDVVDPVLGAADPATIPADNWNMFIRGNVILGQNFSQPELDHTDYTTSSFQLGTDYQFGHDFLIGTLFDYNHTDTALDGQGSSATIDSYSPGFFASYAQGGWFANALATYSHNSYTEQRNISIGDFGETANGAPEGDQELVNLDGGYEFHRHQWTVGPTAGLQYTHLNIDSFTESGGCSADLAVGDEAADSVRSRFGGRISYAAADQADRMIFTPYLDTSWQHEFCAGSRCIDASFSELGGGTFIVSTPATSRDSVLAVAGLDADISTVITLFTDYQVQAGENDYFGQSVQAGMKIAF
jgi:uncharacterized protein with beta-barrel porin domain